MRERIADTNGKTAGIILSAGAISGALVIALHPHRAISGPNLMELISGSPHMSGASPVVHGMMIALISSWILALSILATRLGLDRPSVRAGLVAYVIGGVLAMSAGLINGFIAPEVAGMSNDISILLWHTNQVLSKFGIVAMSVGIAFWSVNLLHMTDKMVCLVGAAGVLIGSTLTIAMLAKILGPSLLGMGVAVASQGLWYLLVSALLIARKL